MPEDRRMSESRRLADIDRLARIETRLVQLMLYLDANPNQPNVVGGFFDQLREELDDPNPYAIQTNGDDGDGLAPGTNWAGFDRPAYLRRRGECAQCPHAALAAAASQPAS